MKKTFYCFAVALLTCGLAGISYAAGTEAHNGHAAEGGRGVNLSHDLKMILLQEMNKIEGGMMQMIPAISAGDWLTIADTAKKLKNSFILKQKLTPKQMQELHHSLPVDFIELDHSFHATAGKLAHAALQRDGELVNFYFGKLHGKCMECHSVYAAERFPGLKDAGRGEGDKH